MKTVLITGTTGGIGKEFAKLAANKNTRLVLVSRNIEKLETQKKELSAFCPNIEIFACDFTNPQAPLDLQSFLEGKNLFVDELINNVGFDSSGLFEEVPWSEIQDMMTAMMHATVQCTYLFLPHMKQQHYGRILNVSSLAAYYPWPNNAVYSACKSFLLQWSLSISSECQGSGVTCTVVCPGPTNTGFAKRAGLEDSHMFDHAATAASVAKVGYEAMQKGNPLVTPGAGNTALVGVSRILPKKWALQGMGLLRKPKKK